MNGKMLASLAVLSMVAAPTIASAATKSKPQVHKTQKKKDKTAPTAPSGN